MSPQGDTRGSVYFLQAPDGGPVKIGFSTALRTRLTSIQMGSPIALRLVALIEDRPARDEGKLHAMFHEHRLHGEWFFPTPELLAIIRLYADLPERYVADTLVEWLRLGDRRLSVHRPRKVPEAEHQRPFRANYWGLASDA